MDAGTGSWRQHAAGAAKWINRSEGERVGVGVGEVKGAISNW